MEKCRINLKPPQKDSSDYTNRKTNIQTVTKASESGIFDQKEPVLTALLDPYLREIVNTIRYFHPTQFSVAKEMVS